MKNQPIQDTAIIDAVCNLALKAGAKALEVYHSEFWIEEKGDA